MYNALVKFIKRLKNIGNSDRTTMYDQSKQTMDIKTNDGDSINLSNDSGDVILNTNINITKNIQQQQQLPPVPQISPFSTMFVIKNSFIMNIWCRLKRFRAIGICFAFLSVLFWSFNGLSFKLNHHIHALEILTISSLVVSLTYLAIMFTFYGVRYRTKNNNWNTKVEPFNWTLLFGVPGERTSLAMRCLCGTISLACFYSSYRYIPLGDSTTIRFTSPVFIAIFAHFIVNEPFGLLQIINSLTTLIGVILIGRPSFIFGMKTTPLNEPYALNVHMDTPSPYNNTALLWRRKSNAQNDHSSSFSTSSAYDASSSKPTEHSQSNDFDPMNLITIFTSNPLNNNNYVVGGGTETYSTPTTHTNIGSITTVDQTSSLLINDWSSTLFGVFLSLIAAISISISMIFMRKLRKTPPPLVIFWFSSSNVILGAIGLWIIGEYRWPQGLECWLLILMTTICSGLDQFCITLALKLENAGAVAVIQALCVVLSFIFSISILHEPLYWTSALGGTFIFFSVLMLGFSKLVEEKNYSNIKSTIFAIKILHSNSKKFKLDDKFSHHTVEEKNYSNVKPSLPSLSSALLPPSLSSSALPSSLRKHSLNLQFSEPYLLRVSPISGEHYCGICIQNLDMNNNQNNKENNHHSSSIS